MERGGSKSGSGRVSSRSNGRDSNHGNNHGSNQGNNHGSNHGSNQGSGGDPERSHRRHRSHRHQPVNEKNLLVATLLNLVITVVEVAGGILSGSLALLSDAVHNLSDTFATLIAYLATLIGKRDANRKKTFGYKRMEILVAMLNAVVLIVMSVFLMREAFIRWKDPKPVNSMIMLVVAMVGLLANLYAVNILKRDAAKSLNVKAAYVHLIGDSLSSVVVILGGIVIQIFGLIRIDAFITVLISLYIIKEAYSILKEAVSILMQSTPGDLDLRKVKRRVERIRDVHNIHHIHAWMLTDNEVHLEAHIELSRDLKLSQVHNKRTEIETLLRNDFQVGHITLQFEYNSNHAPHLIHTED